MKIFIDNAEADLDQRTNVAISLSVASHTQLEASKTGYSKTITIPMTHRNMGIMGDSEQINSPGMFNRAEHTARVEHDGCTVIEGVPWLVESSCGGPGGGFYRLNIIGPGKKWVKYASETPLRTLDVEFGTTLGEQTIIESWTWDKPVRFLPVQRDGYGPDNVNDDLFDPLKILTYEDYHPFLHVRSIVEKVFANAGYRVESQFMSGLLFDSLYMSGNYVSVEAEALQEDMAFRAGRFVSATSTADYRGRVYANPYLNVNSVGNIVQTANPNEYRNGVNVAWVYSVGECFRANGSHMEFKPTEAVSVAFEYSLYYTTAYRMKSRAELEGFDTVCLGDGQEHKFTLANPFADKRKEMKGGVSYNVTIFDHAAGQIYYILYKRITNPDADPENLVAGDYTQVATITFSERVNTISVSTAYPLADPTLYWLKTGMTGYEAYPYDWALYEGYVSDSGTREVEVVVRSSVERVLPSEPKTFYDIYFGGAKQGMSFTLGSRTTMRPIFSYGPSVGSAIGFPAVAAHSMNCLDLMNGIKQMFNLYFLTDQVTNTVYVEPRRDFYADGPVVDWSGRVDFSKPVVVSEPGADMYRTLSFGYAGGDAAVAEWNRNNGGAYGTWGAEVFNVQARDGEKSYVNSVFRASVNEKGALTTAPSALLLHAGGTEEEAEQSSGDLNFTPKIVRYLGMKTLPQGESWGWPGGGSSYPCVVFHYAGDANTYTGSSANPLSTFGEDVPTLWQNGLSLCFEDRDGVAGLHGFWDGNITALNESKRVELSLVLHPEEVEAMLSPNSLGRDFRALYRLTIYGESALFRLEEVCDYNPAAGGSTRCVFIKET